MREYRIEGYDFIDPEGNVMNPDEVLSVLNSTIKTPLEIEIEKYNKTIATLRRRSAMIVEETT